MRTLFCFALVLSAVACGVQGSAKSPDLDVLECQVKAVEPSLGAAFDVADLVRKIDAGEADLNAVLAQVRASASEAKAVVAAFKACSASPADAGSQKAAE